MKNIVLISNPFGFGPASNLNAILQELYTYNVNLFLLVGKNSLDLFDIKTEKVKILQINERSESEIDQTLLEIDSPHIISSLNRFALSVAQRRNYKSVFIDCLSWFWEEIPLNYLNTDTYYALNFIGLKNKVLPQNAKVVPYPCSSFDNRGKSKKITPNKTYINIGGYQNPLVDTTRKSFYLDLLAYLASNSQTQIKILGGNQASVYLNKNSNNPNLSETYTKEDFDSLTDKLPSLISVAGINSTVECLFSNTEIIYYLPWNLSQNKLGELLQNERILSRDRIMCWEDYFPEYKKEMHTISEKESIQLIEFYAEKALDDVEILKKISSKFNLLVTHTPQQINKNYKDICREIAGNGIECIANDLSKQWNISKTNLDKDIR